MKIYTKKGDKGDTSLLYGDQVSKDNIAPEAYGSVDELVAALGLIRCEDKLPIEVKDTTLRIQRELFIVGVLSGERFFGIIISSTLSNTPSTQWMNSMRPQDDE